MGKVLFFDNVAGVAGDMFSAAFVDAGFVSVDDLNALASKLGFNGIRITAEKTIKATISSTKLNVVVDDPSWKNVFGNTEHTHGRDNGHHHHHDETSNLLLDAHDEHWHVHYPQIDALIERSSLDDATRELSRRIYSILADAEASVHGVEVHKAAFHEIGAADSIMDVVMAAHCIVTSGVSSFFATPIKPGRGSIRIAHGTHNVPPPASARLLAGLRIAATPQAITEENIELSTPTGIAILKALDPEFVSELPAGKLIATGRGAGTKDLGAYPNIFQVSLLETASIGDLPYRSDRVMEISFNVDDDTGEHMAWVAGQMLRHGAVDVWQTQVIGKKGRGMNVFSALCPSEKFAGLADWVMKNSTTFGLRYREWDRLVLDAEFESRDVEGRQVRFKSGKNLRGETVKEKPEFDDLNS